MQSPPHPQQHLPPPPPPPSTQEPPVIRRPSQESQASVPVKPEPRPEPVERARQPLLLDTNIKKQPPRKGGSIFTPIDENQSVLLQHIAAFQETPPRSQSIDVGSVSRGSNAHLPAGPHQRPNNQAPQPQIKRNGSLGNIPGTVFTPPSRSNSMQAGGAARPRLKVQIPDESDGGSTTNGSTSPRGTTSTDITSQPSRRPADSHTSGVVLPPPSPSASAMPNETLLSAGATGPPNPFARPLPHQNNSSNITISPVSALPSRFLNNEFLPSPSSFYPDWNFRGNDNNTLPSPLNFATPVVGTGPSFLRDDPLSLKRKSPEISGSNGAHPEPIDAGGDAKRTKIES
jgi:MADS-box transcription factor